MHLSLKNVKKNDLEDLNGDTKQFDSLSANIIAGYSSVIEFTKKFK